MAIGMSRTVAARSRSLTIRTSLRSHRSTRVPAIGLRIRFGMQAGDEDEAPTPAREPVDEEHDRGQGDLVDAVAEQRDELAGPQRGERAVEGESDVGVSADPLPASPGRAGGA